MAAGVRFIEGVFPPGVRAAYSTREGGVSTGPFASLNLGAMVDDVRENVLENRRLYAQALGARPVFIKQVHGWNVAQLDTASQDGAEADATLTTERGVACTVGAADCLPILLSDESGRVVGAAHAGWRGLVGRAGVGVVESLWERFVPKTRMDTAQAASKSIAWLGPCIGPRAFEVGPEVREAFVAADAGADGCFVPQPGGKYLANLQGLARRRLAALGITRIHGNDGSDAWCTVANPSVFFSHRRDRGLSGRLAASIWRA
jgi:YfiH family protein